MASSTRAGSLCSIRRTTFSAKIVYSWIGQSFVVQVNDQWKFSRRIILGCAARISDLKQIKVNDVNNAYLAMISYQSSILHFKQFKREPAFECGWTEKRRSKKTIWNLLSMYSLSNNHLLNSSSDFLVFSVEFSNFSIKSISDAFEHKQTHFWTQNTVGGDIFDNVKTWHIFRHEIDSMCLFSYYHVPKSIACGK